MNREKMADGLGKTLVVYKKGQSMVEFALVLPLMVLFVIGIFDLGRAFFAYIAITNAAREGTRVASFWPGKATLENIYDAVDNELANSPTVNASNPHTIKIECDVPTLPGVTYDEPTSDSQLASCTPMMPIRVTVTYHFEFILNFFIPSIEMTRSAQMLLP